MKQTVFVFLLMIFMVPLFAGKLEKNVKVKKDGEYAYKLVYQLASGSKDSSVKVEVDGLYVCTQKLKTTNGSETVYINNTSFLTKGEHSIKVQSYKGNGDFESVELVEVSPEVKAQIKQPELCNKNATKEAQNLYNYLIEMRGKGILSGQQIYNANDSEIKVIQNVTGKYPAVLGIDLIDYSPSRVARGTNPGRLISLTKKYWEAGGIITCCWHWNAPMNLVDKDISEMRWYDGFRTKATTYDFSIALNDPNSEEYKTMMRDIDAIASKLQLLKDANIPILWRPLHEASGKWFWWGSKGAENYIRLYKLMYDQLVNVYHLDNLIWVWNGQDPDWYPGDEYVDIISYDYYPMKQKHGTADEYLAKIQSATVEPKLCALSENGALPNVVKLEQEKSVWNWWCTWNGEFVVGSDGKYSGSYTSLEALKLYYENPYTITRDEVPNLK